MEQSEANNIKNTIRFDVKANQQSGYFIPQKPNWINLMVVNSRHQNSTLICHNIIIPDKNPKLENHTVLKSEYKNNASFKKATWFCNLAHFKRGILK